MSAAAEEERPRLVFFYSKTSGQSRRMERYLAQVLQRRANHETFRLHHVEVADRSDLAEHFAVKDVPTLVVVEANRVEARLDHPRSCVEVEKLLAPWLR